MPADAVDLLGEGAPVPALDWSALFARRTALAGNELTAILSLAASRDIITFAGGFPAPETFPVDVIRELTSSLLDADAGVALQYSPTEGLSPAGRRGTWPRPGTGPARAPCAPRRPRSAMPRPSQSRRGPSARGRRPGQ